MEIESAERIVIPPFYSTALSAFWVRKIIGALIMGELYYRSARIDYRRIERKEGPRQVRGPWVGFSAFVVVFVWCVL
jgi:hypothetical protein